MTKLLTMVAILVAINSSAVFAAEPTKAQLAKTTTFSKVVNGVKVQFQCWPNADKESGFDCRWRSLRKK